MNVVNQKKFVNMILTYVFCIDAIVKASTRLLICFGIHNTAIVTISLYILMVLFYFVYILVEKKVVLHVPSLRFILFVFLIYLFSYIYFPGNRDTLIRLLKEQAWVPLLIFWIFAQLYNKAELSAVFKASAYTLFVCSIIILLVTDKDLFIHGGVYMQFGYFMIVPAVFFLQFYLREHNNLYLILSGSSIVLVLIYGNRGALICYLGFIVISTLVHGNSLKNIFVMIFILFVAYIFIKNMDVILSVLTIDTELSRNFTYLISGKFLSTESRQNGYRIVLDGIKNHWILGMGLCSDRVLISGGILNTYAHNLFLEVFLSFGVPLGSIFLVVFLYKSIKLIINEEYSDGMFTPLFATFFFRLLISDSFIVNTSFFIGMVFIINSNSFKFNNLKYSRGKNEKTNNRL